MTSEKTIKRMAVSDARDVLIARSVELAGYRLAGESSPRSEPGWQGEIMEAAVDQAARELAGLLYAAEAAPES